jgi:cyclophilin family peptidyl-prolyl cis-trans isomerase
MKRLLIPILMCVLSTSSFAQIKKAVTPKKQVVVKPKTVLKAPVTKAIPGTRIKITTDSGVIIVRLYDKTPQHKANLSNWYLEHFYDSLINRRVINEFMIQGGDPGSKNASYDMMLGGGDVGYMVPAEFDSTLYHKKVHWLLQGITIPKKLAADVNFILYKGKNILMLN